MKIASLPVKPKVEITHSQSMRQVINYQSAEAQYSVKMVVDDTPAAIAKGISRAETLVEEALAAKVSQQRKFLMELSK